jgi:hypothetical protein
MKWILFLLSACTCLASADIPLPQPYILYGCRHIRFNGPIGMVLVRNYNLGQYYLWCYNINNFQNALVTLPGATDAHMGLSQDFDVSGTNVYLTGGYGVNSPVAYHYGLSSELPLPLTATLLDTNLFADPTAGDAVVTVATNGGVIFALSSNTNQSAVFLFYRFPDGTTTNYGYTTLAGSAAVVTTHFAGANMPGDGTWWGFMNKDTSGVIWASQFAATNGLSLIKSFGLFDNRTSNGTNIWGERAPYGEVFTPESMTDTVTNRILLYYPNNDCGSVGDTNGIPPVQPEGGTKLVFVGVLANTNSYLIQTNDTLTSCLANGFGFSQTGNQYQTLFQDHSPAAVIAVKWPLRTQILTDASASPSTLAIDNVRGGGNWSFAFQRPDYAYRVVADGLDHLFISGSPANHPFPPTTVSVTGNVTIKGNVQLQ